ncbi:MAG: EAL domain-containing protein [Comamonadaceae bacterium]|nr:EAL domain-containing protein [Comamonadaceae bacterium]
MPDNPEILAARILIVDDKQANILLLQQMLESAGYLNITGTCDPLAVYDLHRHHRYDLILLDLQMPGMDGFEVMEALQGLEPGGYLPVLAITVQPGYKLRALSGGAKDFIAKPFDVVELKTRIHNMIEVRLRYKKLAHAVTALESEALHDGLTGLPNRRLLLDRLQQSRRSSARAGNHCALMFLDLDHFKQVNDTLGHDAGDLLLQQVAGRLQSCLREGDSVARLGGDEFVVLQDALSLSPEEAAKQAERIASKILLALDQSYSLNGHAYSNTVSIGIVVFRGDQEPIGSLLKKADLAMYRAKSIGRNQLCIFDPGMRTQVQVQDSLASDIHRALAAGEFELYYQIQVDTRDQLVGAEALLRWNHPQHGLMVPREFLPLAEETGVILPLADWVLETACQQLMAWAKDPQTAHWTLVVNVGACQLAQADFVAKVIRIVQDSAAPAQRLTLELTEGTLLNNVEDVIAKMTAVRVAGVGICLDNFGAGFASLAYLKRLPLGQIKVDQAMVQTVLSDAGAAVIARAIVALGASLGLPVIVEGVESAAQRDFFAELGCQAFQGNFFAPALPASELNMLYKTNQAPAL